MKMKGGMCVYILKMRESTFFVKVGRVAEPDESRVKVQTG